ncbi:MAG: hypothetical protein LBS50_03450 [Prevotellaceae bacterium]|jgi:uncharacterized protein (TIGR02145 family)|nr:hypothetical protein [Prevotellaceae bacterium]
MKNSRSFNFPTASILMLTLALAMSGNARAQVTIGKNFEPQSFSVLELISLNSKGMRLPQMDSVQRNTMMETQAFKNEKKGKALGLTIFNTSTYCVETWNGTKWIEQCMPCEGITFPALDQYYNFCYNATVADLEEKIGGADIYDSATDGNKYSTNVILTNGTIYYAVPKVANCVAPARTAVTVYLGDCSIAPINARLTTFVNVMYDFQHQTIEAYNISGGIGIDYKWKVGTSSSSFTDIPDAPNSPFFTIPANFSDNYNSGDYLCDTLWFQCEIKNPANPSAITPAADLDIIFIKTTSAGYGEHNGVKYLTLERGYEGNVQGGTMKVALLNLGQSADWKGGKVYTPNNDAGDIGDFYQWGRIADGHQNIVWRKGNHQDSIRPYGAIPANTSDTVARGTPSYDSNLQILDTETNYYGKFIVGHIDHWHTSTVNDSLWGNGTNDRAHDPANLSEWSTKGKNNNPCPAGWRVPSRWNFWDLLNGTGIDTDITEVYFSAQTKNNTWQIRNYNGQGTVVGGAITTNAAGEKIFLPALGYRFTYPVGMYMDLLMGCRTDGNYWSSTSNTALKAYDLSMSLMLAKINPGTVYFTFNKSGGKCVRCVADF